MKLVHLLVFTCVTTGLVGGARAAQAPELSNITHWHNSQALSMASLRGKVVLVDFWTYNCINCIRTLPYINKWHAAYKEKGLVVIGIHTPEFPFERSVDNVKRAIQRHGITYPVAQDNHYATWKAYENKYWPASYLIDRKGRIVKTHIGEGDYVEMEAAIRKLVNVQ